MREVLSGSRTCCQVEGLRPPARATVSKLVATTVGPSFRVPDLPATAQAALYDLAPESDAAPHHVAFSCFDDGDMTPVSFATGMPRRPSTKPAPS